MSLQIRKSSESDSSTIADVAAAAFGSEEGQEIVELIDALASDPSAQPSLSLVATMANKLVGHILFTKTRIANSPRSARSAILAPLSVHPEYQRQGIGGQLIREGVKLLRATDIELLFVLGHPDYYPKFGFSPAAVEGLDAPRPIAPEHADAWMVRELQPGVLGHVTGVVMFANALSDPADWRE